MQIRSFRGSGKPARFNARLLKCAFLFGTRSAQSIRADEADPDGIGHSHEYNRNGSGCRFQGYGSLAGRRAIINSGVKATNSAARAGRRSGA